MYRYVPVHTILPDPVQVYRIPDAVGWPASEPMMASMGQAEFQVQGGNDLGRAGVAA